MPRISSPTTQALTVAPQQDLVSNIETARLRTPWFHPGIDTLTCVHWDPSGLRFWVGFVTNRIREYTVSTAFDLTSTVTFVAQLTTNDPVYAIWLKPEKDRMFYLSNTTLNSYTLNTPGTIAGDWVPFQAARNLTTVIGGPPAEDQLTGMDFSPDGTRLTVVGDVRNTLFNISLSSAWNIQSTLAVAQSLAFGGVDTSPQDFHWGPDGLSFYVLTAGTYRIRKYTAAVAYTLPASLTAAGFITVNTELQDNVLVGMDFSADGTKIYIATQGLYRVNQLTISPAWDLFNGFQFQQNQADQAVMAELTPGLGGNSLTFKPDGTQVYTVNSSTIYQYSMSTAYNLSTVANSGSQALDVGLGSLSGLAMHPEGTRFYVLGIGNDFIREYTMATPWTVAGATSTAVSPSFSSRETSARGLYFRPDGQSLYITGNFSQTVLRYDLSTAWDITTMVFAQSAASLSLSWSDLHFSPNGRRLWLATSPNIRQYNLSSPWDLSTLTLDTTISVERYDSLASGIFLRPDGLRLYLSMFQTIIGINLGAPTASITLTAGSSAADEGDTVNFTVATENIANGTVFQWAANSQNASDLIPSSGSVTISSGSAAFSTLVDFDFLEEGEEAFTITLSKPTGTTVATSAEIAISDTSAAEFSLGSTADNFGRLIDSGDSIEFEFTAIAGSVPNGYTFYWTTDTPEFFTSGSGSFTYNSGFGLGTFTLNSISPFAGTFTVSVRRNSVSGPVLRTSNTYTIVDPATYAVTPQTITISEGDSLVFSVATTLVDDGTVLYWTLSSPSDFAQGSGSFVINGNAGSFTVTSLLDLVTEGTETFTASVRRFSTSGPIKATSETVTIIDVGPTVTISAAAGSVDEGSPLEFTVSTTNITDGTTLYWTATNAVDLAAASGSFSVSSGSAAFSVTPTADFRTEGAETFTVSVRRSSISGEVLATSDVITINDTSITSYTITPAANNVNEGSPLTFNVTTQIVTDDTVLYWTVTNAGDFGTANGSVIINNNAGSFTVTPTADLTTEGAETFTVSLRTGSVSGTVVATSTTVTINDTSVSSYTVTPAASSVNEGSSVTFNVTTTGLADGTALYWTVSNASDFATASGTFTINSNAGSFSVTPSADLTLEGSETFTASVRTGSVSGTVVATSTAVTINDTSVPTYSVTPAANNVNEGTALNFSVSTTGVANNTTLYWTVSNAGDFETANGSFTINSNAGSFSVTPTADFATEGAETFTASVRTGSVSGTVVATSTSVTINDTSVLTYTVTPAANNVNEGSPLTFNVTTQGLSNGTTLYWTVTNSGDFVAASGSFIVNSNSGSFSVTPTADLTTEGSETFIAQVRTGSVSGDIVAISSSVTINDTSIATYTVTPAANNVDEGVPLNVSVTTPALSDGTTLYWTVTNAGDFGTASGSFTINSNAGSFTVTPTADLTTEGAETFQIEIRSDSTSGTVLVTSSTVTINDSSTAPGLLDTTFNTNVGSGFGNRVQDVATFSDGRLVVGGQFTTLNGTTVNRLVLLNRNGTRDTTFTTNLSSGFGDEVLGVETRAAGTYSERILVGGFFTTFKGSSKNGIVMLGTDGNEQVGFDEGTGLSGFLAGIRDIVPLPSSERFLIAGSFTGYRGTTANRLTLIEGDGTIVSSFATNLNQGFDGTLFGIARQSDGKFVVAGFFTSAVNSTLQNNVTRINADGTLDTAFASSIGTGLTNTDEFEDSTAYALALQSDGKILIGGSFNRFNGSVANKLVRLNSNGTIDSTFASAIGTGFSGGTSTRVTEIIVQPDQKIIVVGEFTSLNGTTQNRITRLNSNGSIDTVFSANMGTGFSGGEVWCAVYQESLKKIVCGGNFTSFNGTSTGRIARINA